MKKFLAIVLTIVMSLSLVCLFIACGEKESSDNSSVSVKKIENIGDYAIIRSSDATDTVAKSASSLSADLLRKLDTKVISTTDSKNESTCEILVGKTLRKIDGVDYNSIGLNEYIIKLVDKKIVIAGGSDKATIDAVDFFISNLVSEDGVRVPTGNGYSYEDTAAYKSIKIDGTSISEYTILTNLYDSTVAEAFAAEMENITYCTLKVLKTDNASEFEGKYILLDDTNTDFTNYSITIENGNITLYANYVTINDCIEYFYRDILGYDTENCKIIGEKTVEITSSMSKSFTVEKSPVYTKEKLMSVLGEVYENDDMIIIGQQMSERAGETMVTERQLYTENCGVDAAMYGYDLGTMEANYKSTVNARVKDAYDMIEYMREGGILTFSAHFDNPTGDGIAGGESHYRGELGHEDKWDEVMTEGTELNLKFMDTLSQVADFLEIFHKNGAPIIFRPLHEMNGNWFWFCIVNGEDNYLLPREYARKLWVFIYDYIVTERGIDSLIWEYGPNVARETSGSMADVMYCYPGDEYCDIVAVDWYTGDYEGHEMLTIADEAMKATGKIFSVSEFGPGEDIRTDFSVSPDYKYTCTNLDRLIEEIREDGIKTCYWLLWSSWAEVKISMWNMGDAKLFYENDLYLTLEDTYKLLYE